MRKFQFSGAETIIIEWMRLLSQPQRLQILLCLSEVTGGYSVSQIAERTGIPQPALSQQLAQLRQAQLLSTHKEARHVWYHISRPEFREFMRILRELSEQQLTSLPSHSSTDNQEPPLPKPRRTHFTSLAQAGGAQDSKAQDGKDGVAHFAKILANPS